MITLQVNKGHVTAGAAGAINDLLSETGIGLGNVLYKITETCPDDELKQTIIKGVFELTLQVMKDLEEGKG